MNDMSRRALPHMTTDEFLAWPGDGSGRRFQLVDGDVRPVSPASRTHGIIQFNLSRLIGNALLSGSFQLQGVIEAAIVLGLNAGSNVRVPDIAVAPKADYRGEQIVSDPVLLIEILSPGNLNDTRDNVRGYANLPSVREIAVFHTSRVRAELYRRDAAGHWPSDPELIETTGRLTLITVGLDCAVEDAYHDTFLTRG